MLITKTFINTHDLLKKQIKFFSFFSIFSCCFYTKVFSMFVYVFQGIIYFIVITCLIISLFFLFKLS